VASRSTSDQPPTAIRQPLPPVLIELDPGLAFGTGTHPTTALCLEWLDSADVAGRRVIDYGCGSGILAIAAAKLGAASVTAVDIDPQALLATHDNALRNGVAQLITAHLADESSLATADILLANILAGPLESLAPAFAARVTAGGCLVLSGILQNQAEAVASRYAPWFDIAPVVVRDGWARLDGVRRPTPPL
jgi:ribosomal protein L11 methyltransferase